MSRERIAQIWQAIVDWRTRKFMATLPPTMTKGDGGAWILERFQETNGQPFNPFSAEDRKTVEIGVSRARSSSLTVLFGRKEQAADAFRPADGGGDGRRGG